MPSVSHVQPARPVAGADLPGAEERQSLREQIGEQMRLNALAAAELREALAHDVLIELRSGRP